MPREGVRMVHVKQLQTVMRDRPQLLPPSDRNGKCKLTVTEESVQGAVSEEEMVDPA